MFIVRLGFGFLVGYNFVNHPLFMVYLFTIIIISVVYGVLTLSWAYSSTNPLKTHNRSWSQVLGWVYTCYFGLIVILGLASGAEGTQGTDVLNQAGQILSMIASCTVLFFAVKYKVILQKTSREKKPQKSIESPNLPLKENKPMLDLFDRLDHLVVDKKLYLNPTISISELSKELSVNRNYVSQAINRASEKSFTLYINEYRIEYFTQLLTDDKFAHYSLEALSQESGFNSISSFNRACKVIKGMSPSEYRKELVC